MSRTIEEILAPKHEARPRLYAYTIEDQAHDGLLKIGQTSLGGSRARYFI
jgi:hypothetical protein